MKDRALLGLLDSDYCLIYTTPCASFPINTADMTHFVESRETDKNEGIIVPAGRYRSDGRTTHAGPRRKYCLTRSRIAFSLKLVPDTNMGQVTWKPTSHWIPPAYCSRVCVLAVAAVQNVLTHGGGARTRTRRHTQRHAADTALCARSSISNLSCIQFTCRIAV